MVHDETRPTTYRVELKGPIPTSLAGKFDGFTVEEGPTSTLTGPVADCAQLYGLIARLESLGLTLISVRGTTSVPPSSLSEHSRLLLATHQAMRADGGRLISAVADLGDRDPDASAALGGAFATIVALIHDHHRAEDDVMYPFLVDRVAGFERHATQLERDHVHLNAAMARVSAELRLLTRPTSAAIRQATQQHLVDDVHAFNDVLVDHLDREEAAVIPPFESMLSAGDQHLLSKAESKLTTYRHVRTAVPWVLANANAEEAAELRALVPWIVSVVHDHVWKHRFHRRMAPLYVRSPTRTAQLR